MAANLAKQRSAETAYHWLQASHSYVICHMSASKSSVFALVLWEEGGTIRIAFLLASHFQISFLPVFNYYSLTLYTQHTHVFDNYKIMFSYRDDSSK